MHLSRLNGAQINANGGHGGDGRRGGAGAVVKGGKIDRVLLCRMFR